MRKRIVLILALISLLALTGCGSRGERHTLEFTIPAGFTDAFAFSDKALDYDTFTYSAEEISPTRKTLTIKAGAGYSSVPVILKVVECRVENAYEPILLTHDKPVTINVETILSNSTVDMTGGTLNVNGDLGRASGNGILIGNKIKSAEGLENVIWFELITTDLGGKKNTYQLPLVLNKVA